MPAQMEPRQPAQTEPSSPPRSPGRRLPSAGSNSQPPLRIRPRRRLPCDVALRSRDVALRLSPTTDGKIEEAYGILPSAQCMCCTRKKVGLQQLTQKHRSTPLLPPPPLPSSTAPPPPLRLWPVLAVLFVSSRTRRRGTGGHCGLWRWPRPRPPPPPPQISATRRKPEVRRGRSISSAALVSHRRR
jgi:hypothetical protein